jgi:hypothetical protein
MDRKGGDYGLFYQTLSEGNEGNLERSQSE